MIDVSKVRFRNVLSFGNGWTEIDFINGQIFLVVGENGRGKSAIYEAIFFSLYGKPFRKIKKDGLVNSVNRRELETEIEFTSSGKHYRIRRGIKPGIFEIFVDGKLKNQDAASRDYQEFLERHVLRMDERTFRQKVVLGSSSFVPFMKLSAGERRTVVEDVLGVSIYSVMLQLAKQRVSELRGKYEAIKIENDKDKIRHEMLLKQSDQNTRTAMDHILDRKKKVDSLQADYEKALSEIPALEPLIEKKKKIEKIAEDLDSKVSMSRSAISKYEAGTSRLDDEVEFFKIDHSSCPTCDQPISKTFVESKLSQLALARQTNTDLTKSYAEHLNQFLEELADARRCQAEVAEAISERAFAESAAKSIASTLHSEQTILSSMEERKKEITADIDKDIQYFETRILESQTQLKEIGKEGVDYTKIVELLKDDGIKAKIVRDYLPVVNRLINKYLQILEFPVVFTFDENFDEVIKARGRDEFSYGAFSEGEKMRLDLALLFTWREVTRLRSSSHCNLIVLDEIGDSSLDESGLEAFMKILNTEREKQCAMIISHKPQGFSNQVNRTIEVKKPSVFSQISITEHQTENSLL